MALQTIKNTSICNYRPLSTEFYSYIKVEDKNMFISSSVELSSVLKMELYSGTLVLVNIISV